MAYSPSTGMDLNGQYAKVTNPSEEEIMLDYSLAQVSSGLDAAVDIDTISGECITVNST